MTAAILYQSRDWSNATPSGMPRRKYPLPQQAPNQFAAYAFDCDFEQRLDKFPPAPKNTPSNFSAGGVIPFGLGDGNAILTSLTQPTDTKNNKGKFTGTFHVVPATWDDFLTQAVTFPGIRDTNIGGARDPKPLNVLTRQHREYFVADPTNVLTGLAVKDSGGNNITIVSSKGAIATLPRTPWKYLVSGAVLSTSEVTGLVKAGGLPGYFETLPNTGTYTAWIAVAAAFNAQLSGANPQPWTQTAPPLWNGTTGTDQTIGQYRFTDSRIEDYAGNIFCRVSEYVLVQ